MKIYEIISPKDKLDDSLEMIKGGVSSELRLCMKGCHTGELKPKPSDPTIPAEPKPKDDTADTPTINTNISSSNML